MLGNFKYSNPTTLYFGKDALNALRDELKQYGPTIMLSYGGGSIKRNGIYDAVIEVLQTCGKHIVEDAGVMPNPTAESLAAVRSYRLPPSLHPFHRDDVLKSSCNQWLNFLHVTPKKPISSLSVTNLGHPRKLIFDLQP